MSRRKRAKKDPVEEAEEESGLEKLLFGDDEIGERFGTETAGQARLRTPGDMAHLM